jgi:hypothetical protein
LETATFKIVFEKRKEDGIVFTGYNWNKSGGREIVKVKFKKIRILKLLVH